MKRNVIILAMSVIMMIVFMVGYGNAAEQSVFHKRPSVYKNWDHLWYSWQGYKYCKEDDSLKSKEDGWWGKSVTCSEREWWEIPCE